MSFWIKESMLVSYTGDDIQLTISTSGSLLPGDLYQLTCNATHTLVGFQFQSLPSVYWTHDGNNITSDISQGFEIKEAVEGNAFVSRSLVLYPVRQSHAGQYCCVAVQHEEVTYVEESVKVLGER